MASKYRQLVVESHPILRDLAVSEEQTSGELISASASGELAFCLHNRRDVKIEHLDPSQPSPNARLGDISLSAPATDLAFAPLVASLLAIGTQDSSVKLWSAGVETSALSAAGALVSQVKWHPSSSNLLAVSSGPNLQVFDVSQAKPIAASASSASPIMSVSWNLDGSLLFVSSPNTKQLSAVDPRQGLEPVVLVSNTHAGTKFLTCEFAGDMELVSCGQNSNRDREVALWDIRSGKQSLYRSRIDSSQNYLRAQVDLDTNLVYFMGHQDANIRVYEKSVGSGANGAALAPLGNFTLNGPSASVCLAPKQMLHHNEFEVDRLLRFGVKSVQQVSIRIPRKPLSAYEDLFPPTRSNIIEALTVNEYVAGRNAPPVKMDMFAPVVVAPSPIVVETALEEEEPTLQDPGRFSKFLGFQAKMKYNKIVQSNKDQSLFGITPGDFPGDANLLACSSQFVALPWKSIAGGAVYIKSTTPESFQGKLKGEPILVQSHGDKVSCIQFSELDQTLLATGGEDACVRVYRVPESGINSQGDATKLVESSIRLQGHRLGLRGVSFHRVCANLLTTFASDETVKIWDVESGAELVDLSGMPAVGNVDWSYNGNLLAIACKDSSVRVVDPRAPASTKQLLTIPQTHEGLKASRVCWLDTNTLLTTGFGKTGDRQFRLWDLKTALGNGNVSSYLSTSLLDPGSGVMVPTFVEDNGVVVMAAKGEMSIRVFEVEGLSNAASTDKYVMHKCNEFRATGEASLGMAFLPRRQVNYQKAEWLSGYRLTAQAVETLSFQVPRSLEIQGYFYDDLYPPARSGLAAIKSPKEWVAGKRVDAPLLMNLNVLGLKVLSERPAAEAHATIKRGAASVEKMKKEQDERERKELEKQEALARMQRLAVQHEKYNPNLSQSGQGHGGATQYAVDVGPSDVQEDEWDD
ncbi:hypothetical protein BASA81_003816 [Batrachochytrium salamandrivorans]|nr:hypothetical protein BASA81_003816 [Batrachochytrium salamandrivorans]